MKAGYKQRKQNWVLSALIFTLSAGSALAQEPIASPTAALTVVSVAAPPTNMPSASMTLPASAPSTPPTSSPPTPLASPVEAPVRPKPPPPYISVAPGSSASALSAAARFNRVAAAGSAALAVFSTALLL